MEDLRTSVASHLVLQTYVRHLWFSRGGMAASLLAMGSDRGDTTVITVVEVLSESTTLIMTPHVRNFEMTCYYVASNFARTIQCGKMRSKRS